MTVAVGCAVFMIVLGIVFSGRIGVILMPRVESDYAVATAALPFGSPSEDVIATRDQLTGSLQRIIEKNGGEQLVTDIFTHIDNNEVEVTAYLADADIRTLSTIALTKLWRKELPHYPILMLNPTSVSEKE